MCLLNVSVLSSPSRIQSEDACQFLLVVIDAFVSSLLVYWQRSVLTQEKGKMKAENVYSKYLKLCHVTLLYATCNDRRTDRQTNGQTDQRTDRKTKRATYRQTDRWRDRGKDRRNTERPTERQTVKQTERQTDRWTDRGKEGRQTWFKLTSLCSL